VCANRGVKQDGSAVRYVLDIESRSRKNIAALDSKPSTL
jgi:hypothetical protein